MKSPYEILPAWIISHRTTSAGTAFVIQPPDQASAYRLVLAHVRLQNIPSDSTPQPAEVDAMCTDALNETSELLKTDNQWLHDSLPASFDLTPQSIPLVTVMYALIKRDRCRYSISFALWPDHKLPFRLENIDGADIEPESGWSTIAIPSSGGRAWVVKEFVEVPKDVRDLVKTAVTDAKLDVVIAKMNEGNAVGTQTLAKLQAIEPHLEGVPAVLERAHESQREAVARIAHFRQHYLIGKHESAVWDGLVGGKTGKQIAKEEKCSTATISLVKKKVEKRCNEHRFEAPWRGRGGRPPGHSKDTTPRDVSGPKVPVSSDLVTELPMDRREDPD